MTVERFDSQAEGKGVIKYTCPMSDSQFFEAPLTGVSGLGIIQPEKVTEVGEDKEETAKHWQDPNWGLQYKYNGGRLTAYINGPTASWSVRHSNVEGGLSSKDEIMSYITFPASVFGSILDCEIHAEKFWKNVPGAATPLQAAMRILNINPEEGRQRLEEWGYPEARVFDCWTRGTLVSTDLGPVPIESLQSTNQIDTPEGLSKFIKTPACLRKCVKITSKSSLCETCTEGTGLLVFRKGLSQIKASEVRSEDFLVFQKPVEGGEYPRALDFKGSGRSPSIVIDPADDFWWALLGQVLGDGGLDFRDRAAYKGHVYISRVIRLHFSPVTDSAALRYFRAQFKARGIHVCEVGDKKCGTLTLSVTHPGIFKFYRDFLSLKVGDFNNCHKKFLPPTVFGLPPEARCTILRFLFNGDGSFETRMPVLVAGGTKLATDVIKLLWSLGIRAYLQEKKNRWSTSGTIYHVVISDVSKFRDRIGFIEPYKTAQFRASSYMVKLPHPVVLFCLEEFRRMRLSGKLAPRAVKRKLTSAWSNQAASRATLAFLNEHFESSSVAEILSYHYDCVTRVEPAGEKEVFDIEVANQSHLFKLATGMIVHNCLAIKGVSIKDKPYKERLAAATALVEEIDSPHVTMVETIYDNKYEAFQKFLQGGGEGGVIKDLEAPYGAPSSMRKIKRTTTFDCWVWGFIPGKGKYADQIGAFKLGTTLPDGKMVNVSNVNVGTDAERRWATENQKELLGKVYEITFQGWSVHGPQHPRFVEDIFHPREDKSPENSITTEGMVPDNIWEWWTGAAPAITAFETL